MNYFNTTAGYGSAGLQSIACGFAPTMVRCTVGKKNGVTQNFAHFSIGSGDMNFCNVDSVYQDTMGGTTRTDSSAYKLVSHFERNGSNVITEVLAVSLDSFTATGIVLNITTGNPNYSIFIEIFG